MPTKTNQFKKAAQKYGPNNPHLISLIQFVEEVIAPVWPPGRLTCKDHGSDYRIYYRCDKYHLAIDIYLEKLTDNLKMSFECPLGTQFSAHYVLKHHGVSGLADTAATLKAAGTVEHLGNEARRIFDKNKKN